MSVGESKTKVVYKADDRTGPLVDVKKWLYDQESEVEFNLRVARVQVRVGVCIGSERGCVCKWM